VAATVSAGVLSGSEPYSFMFWLLMAFHSLALAGLLLGDALPGPARFPFYFWVMNLASMVGFARMTIGRPVETWDRRAGRPGAAGRRRP